MRQLPNLEAEIVDVLLGLYRDYKPWKAPSWSSKAARGDTAIHWLLFDLIAAGKVDGLRIDHPDGLYDPAHYFQHLQQRRAELRKTNGEGKPLYIVVEKIRASYEHIPKDWTIYGGTGYRFANLVNGVLVDSANQPRLDRLYAGFLGERIDFDEVLYRCKQLIMKVALASELNVLANQLSHLAQVDRHTCDFTLNSLRDALTEIVACFPGYRTYITGERITSQDQRFINWAVATAKKRSQAANITVFDFVHAVLLLALAEGKSPAFRTAVTAFAMKFQQFTSPVMAKGLEDTSFYIYNRLVSLNDVGGDPKSLGISVAAFHGANQLDFSPYQVADNRSKQTYRIQHHNFRTSFAEPDVEKTFTLYAKQVFVLENICPGNG